MISLLSWLETRMETPQPYGLFHLIAVAIVLISAVFICLFGRRLSERAFRRILFVAWAVMFLFEVYKQVFFCFKVQEGVIVGSYQWFVFPFQFCSTPLYVLPLIVFLKEGRVRKALMFFSATFVMFAGFSVLALPGDVFTTSIGINIQTMTHHGLQVLTGLLCLVRLRPNRLLDSFCYTEPVFLSFVALAIALNEILFRVIPGNQVCNLFFISSHYTSTLPVFCDIYGKVPYVVFVLLYVLAFSFATFLTLAFMKLIFYRKKEAKTEKINAA